MAAVLFVKRMSDLHRIEKVLPDSSDPKKKVRAVHDTYNDCPQMTILNVEGALFFGAATKFETEVLDHLPLIRQLIIRMGRVPIIDATGERALQTIAQSCRKNRVQLMISGLQEQPAAMLDSTGFLDFVGRTNVFERTGGAIDRSLREMDLVICATCPHAAFRECPDMKRRGALQTAAARKE
jgi:SulP family sulfate permease